MYVGVPVLPERQLTADSGAISVSLRVLPHDERPIRPMEAPVYAKMYKSDSPIDENAVHIAQAQEDLYSSLDMLRPPPPAFASRKVERKSSSSEDGEEAEAEALYASMISPNVTDTKLTVGTEEREELCATLVLGQEDEDEGEEKDRDQVFV